VKRHSGKASQINSSPRAGLNPNPSARRNSVITSPFAEKFVAVLPLREALPVDVIARSDSDEAIHPFWTLVEEWIASLRLQ
jgi:hypothetical protein